MSSMGKKWTEVDVSDQSGKTVVITGSNTGLGYENARALAQHGATVVLAVRDTVKGDAAAAKIRSLAPGSSISVQPLDLTSLQSVRKAAKDLSSALPKIDILINNAGVMMPPKRQTTQDGFELQLGVNHLGHFALTGLLLSTLAEGSNPRVVSVGSIAHSQAAPKVGIKFDDPHFEKSYSPYSSYGQSKLANILFAYALDRKLKDAQLPIISTVAHPGVAGTELGRQFGKVGGYFLERVSNIFLNTPDMGALASLRAAVDSDSTGGEYYGPAGHPSFAVRGYPVLTRSTSLSHDQELQEKLWTLSEDLTDVKYSF